MMCTAAAQRNSKKRLRNRTGCRKRMGTARVSIEVCVALAVASLLNNPYQVVGFSPSTLGNRPSTAPPYRAVATSVTSTPRQRRLGRSGKCSAPMGDGRAMALQATLVEGSGQGDPLEPYKKQMEEFMALAHERRLQAMDAVKAEVQRGYEEQIAELQAQLAALPGTASSTIVPKEERSLVGATAGASSQTVGSTAGSPHPAYAARSKRPGWEARWGPEEVERTSSGVSAVNVGRMEAMASADTTVNPAYAARLQRPGWETRWGDEESTRAGTLSTGTQSDFNPAYAARSHRPGWEARWGAGESARVAGISATTSAAPAAVPATLHPAYAARLVRPGWEARWGAEELARVSGVSIASGKVETSAAASPSDQHPAYAARNQRPGWESRWGSEEAERVTGVVAGEIARAEAAAEFETAGGLEVEAEVPASATTDAAADVHVRLGTHDPLLAKLLPRDVVELQDLVVSSRRQFQDYLVRSLEANKELKASKTRLEIELSSAKTKLTEEQELRASVQASYLEYMSRNGAQSAEGKNVERKLVGEVARLTAEAADLQLFAQEYMIKAAHEKRKAVQEADANARAQSSEHIKALQAQILKLQAGG